MTTDNLFDTKHPSENFAIGVDFSAHATSIVSATVAIEVASGTDASPSAMLSGSPQIHGARVAQRIIGGLAGVTYRVRITANDAAGNIWVFERFLPVGVLALAA